MKEILFNKINEWTAEKALEFHGGTELFIDYIWEITAEAIIIFRLTVRSWINLTPIVSSLP